MYCCILVCFVSGTRLTFIFTHLQEDKIYIYTSKYLFFLILHLVPVNIATTAALFFFFFSVFFLSSGEWVKIIKLPHFHVSDTCVSI